MADYIDRERAIIHMETEFDLNEPYWPVHFIRYLLNVPSVDVRENVHGYWIKMNYDLGYECSECGWEASNPWDFCPNCGARMVRDDA